MRAAADGVVLIDTGLLRVRSTRLLDEHVLTMFGELDLHSAEAVRSELRRVERSDASRIIVDLANLNLVDAAGVRLMLQAQARLRRDGDRLLVLRGPEPVDRVFRLTGAERLLPFFD
jgi:anti-sigma B factor antagonist